MYRSAKKTDTYLYLLEQDNISVLPNDLRNLLGKIEYTLELNLAKTRKLANAEVDQVISSLRTRGYYLQLPKEHHISE